MLECDLQSSPGKGLLLTSEETDGGALSNQVPWGAWTQRSKVPLVSDMHGGALMHRPLPPWARGRAPTELTCGPPPSSLSTLSLLTLDPQLIGLSSSCYPSHLPPGHPSPASIVNLVPSCPMGFCTPANLVGQSLGMVHSQRWAAPAAEAQGPCN